MSIDTKQIIHIASEVVIIGGITAFFINKTNSLSEKIEELSCKLQQQNDIIQQHNEIMQNHDNLILKLLNTVNMLVQENENSKQQCSVPLQQPKKSIKNEKNPTKSVVTLNNPLNNNHLNNPLNNNPLNNPLNIPSNIPLNIPSNIPSNIPLSLPQNINSRKQVLIMMTNPIENRVEENRVEENRVEEINDVDENATIIPDNTSTILDEELEEELRDLDNEELDNELNEDEDED